ncbi:MAG: family 10 glycosylhydrolase [Ignavibacteriales bacterium]|nr:MAG: family 10 glycosylhydrolase [Ignavibacteriales bacterium]
MTKFFVVLFLTLTSLSFTQEFRGTWIARNTLSSKESLAYAMDSLANNNFNVVFINVWSRGYPLWKSDVFKRETGVEIDPTYAGRDILAEAIAEGHKHGLQVEAWFEYGFVGGWTGNQPAGAKGPIFNAHPDWVAKKQNGEEIDGSNFYWMVHTRKDVQDFMIEMLTEMCRKYDLDGIELDRIRYSSTDYGYDVYTDSLYRAENNNNPPPQIGSDPNWIRWRADKLNEFVARAYDSIKSVSEHINVSNAPSLYSSSSYTAYNSFCQDWVWWVNNGKVDNVQVQSYVTSSSSFSAILDYISGSLITDKSKVYPALAVKPNNTQLSNTVIESMIQTTRSKGFKGNAIWYYTDLVGIFPFIKSSLNQNKAYVPHSSPDWREHYGIINHTDTAFVVKTGAWYSNGLAGNQGFSLSANGGAPAAIDYYADIDVAGYYDIYSFNVTATNRTDSAKAILTDTSGMNSEYFIPQNNPLLKRWYKIGTVFLNNGRKRIVRMENSNLSIGEIMNADAVYFKLNRLLSPEPVTGIHDKKKDKSELNFRLGAYPNPFNSATRLRFNLPKASDFRIKIFDILGNTVSNINYVNAESGEKELSITMNNFSSGIYFANIRQENFSQSVKLVLQK